MPRTIEVDPAKRRAHRTIADAVAAAPAGATIVIAPGTYEGSVVIDRPLQLVATAGSVVLECRAGYALHLTAGARGTSCSGLVIRGWTDDFATVRVEAEAVRFDGCVIEATRTSALWTTSRSSVEVTSCRLAAAASLALSVSESRVVVRASTLESPLGSAVSATDAELTLAGCRMSGFGLHALRLESGVRATIEDCTFDDGRSHDHATVYIGERSDVVLRRCGFTGSVADAVFATGKLRATLAACTFSALDRNAVALAGGATVTVEDLTATDVAGSALLVEGPSRLVAHGVRVSGTCANALVVRTEGRAEVDHLDAQGCSGAAVAVLGGQVELTDSTMAGNVGNVVKVSDGGRSTVRGLRVEAGRVDWPLVVVMPGCSASFEDARFEGGAEDVIAHAGASLTLRDTTIAAAGGRGLYAHGAQATLDACTFTGVRRAVSVEDGCRASLSGCRIDGGEVGVESITGAIVRVDATTVSGVGADGLRCTGAKLIVERSTVTGAGGDGVVLGEEATFEPQDLAIERCAGVGLRSTVALELAPDALHFSENAKGDLQWPGRSTRQAERSVDDLVAELDELVGLAEVKAKIRSLLNLIRLRTREVELGRTSEPVALHAVFTGPPGTGKTTVARIYGELLHAMGLLDSGRFYEVTRADLVVGLIGQTATNTRAKVTEALGGVLFIDEAYSLNQKVGTASDFGEEAVNELVPMMENHRHELAVIAAGYTDEMAAFLDMNPGLKGRFAATIEFPSYQNDELVEIFDRSVRRQQRTCTPDAHDAVRAYFAGLARDRDFANGREVRRLLDAVVEAIANRLAETGDLSEEALSTILAVDVERARQGL